MANGHGGYRQPSNPAPVSGPGALSQRTDGGPGSMEVTGLPYGQNGPLNDIMGAAAMGGQPALGGRGGGSAPPPQAPTSLDAPTQRPGEPVTAGADYGAGPTSADIGLRQGRKQELASTIGLSARTLVRMADSKSATPTFKKQVRQLLASLYT